MKTNPVKAILFFLGVIFIVGCTVIKTPMSAPTPSESPIKRTTVTLIPTTTLTPTGTVVPTLLPEARIKLVENLLEENGGCDLPCWWGITPGSTKWQDAKNVLARLTFIEDDEALARDAFPSDAESHSIEASINISKDIAPDGEIVQLFYIKNGLVNYIQLYGFIWHTYSLSEFLEKNGKPDEIWFHSYNDNFGGPPPFRLMLYYSKKGIFANFDPGPDLSAYKGNTISACTGKGPFLSLWSPEKEVSFLEFFSSFDKPLLPVKRVLGVTVDQFYTEYKNPDKSPCFQFRRDLWPDPYKFAPVD